MKPHDDKALQYVAEAQDNLGQLLFAQGDLAGAERAYRDERSLLQAIAKGDPRDASVQTDLAQAETFYARVAAALGHDEAARDSLGKALRLGETLLSDDAGNAEKMGDLASYNRRLGRMLRLDGDVAGAAPLLTRSRTLYVQMLGLSPDSSRAALGIALTSLEQGRLAWQAHDAGSAQAHAAEAVARSGALLHERSDDRSASMVLAGAQLLLGKIASARHERDVARQAWSRGIDALAVFGADSNDPDQLALQAELQQHLGRAAGPVLARLDAMGYRDAEFVAWAGRRDARNDIAAGSAVR
jgi:tetratricopeptide (TPR) repeat protein